MDAASNPNGADEAAESDNAYEERRQAQIAFNRSKMVELGLDQNIFGENPTTKRKVPKD